MWLHIRANRVIFEGWRMWVLRKAYGSGLFSFTFWFLGMEFRFSGLAGKHLHHVSHHAATIGELFKKPQCW